jgi:4-carboxymuconolactone decarboxylase
LQITDPELIEAFDNFAFDEVISYGNLNTKTRVMLILASTIASQALSEFKVMVGGALNVGNDKETMPSTVTQLLSYVGYPRALNALKYLNEVIPG